MITNFFFIRTHHHWLNSLITRVAKVILSLFVPIFALHGPTAIGQAEYTDINSLEATEVSFNFGDSCARLEELTESGLMELLHTSNLMHWNHFCRIEAPCKPDKAKQRQALA